MTRPAARQGRTAARLAGDPRRRPPVRSDQPRHRDHRLDRGAPSTLGEVIIAGLLSNNLAFVLQGGLIVGALAVLIYDTLVALERMVARRMGE